jgi:hypothetical protein
MTTPASYTPGAGEHFQAGTTPTPETGHVNPAPSGLDYEGIQRISGTYQPGSFGKLEDELSGGADAYQSGEE